MTSIKINSLELENVKRVHHVALTPTANGLTVIGGKNSQGKTSILDAIAWALGGDKYKPTTPKNDEAPTPPKLRVELSNGLIVERKGANGSLYVTAPTGAKAGQKLLDSFIERLAIDLPKFLESNDKEKAKTLLQIIGAEEELAALQQEEERLYSERLAVGRIRDQKGHHFEEMGPYNEGVPDDPISAADLIKQQQEIIIQNAKNNEARELVRQLDADVTTARKRAEVLQERMKQIMSELHQQEQDIQNLEAKRKEAQEMAAQAKDESTEEIEANLRNVENINAKIQFNRAKKKAEEEYKEAQEEYNDLTTQIEQVREDRLRLLQDADLPLPELSVDAAGVTYKGHHWSDMSASEQLRVAVAIVRRLKPECGFVLLDKLEQFDIDTLNEFGAWLEAEGLQVIATRVSTGEECQIIIEDGYIKETPAAQTGWSAGTF